MRSVILTENQFNNLIGEAEWNYHIGSSHDMRPYLSDNKFQMFGRETGHFGSGTYFSTYKGPYDTDRGRYVSSHDNERNTDPHFIQVGNHLYRVDFDLYRNLYRVRSKRQGDILYTMMRNLNVMFNRISYLGEFNRNTAQYDNARQYQIIKQNAEALGLKCPSYYELTRMAQEHAKDKDAIQSFSTLFMEWNGYNGVNVSGVGYYDNTKHGSVIYDLGKTDTEMEEVSPKSLMTSYHEHSYDDTIAMNGFEDQIGTSLEGNSIWWRDKLNDMSIQKAMRLLKNYTDSGHVLGIYDIRELNPELLRRYLRLLYVKKPRNSWGDDLVGQELMKSGNRKSFLDLIKDTGSYYWVNYKCEKDNIFIALLDEFLWDIPWDMSKEDERKAQEEYAEKLMSYMTRELTDKERRYLEEEFLGNDDE